MKFISRIFLSTLMIFGLTFSLNYCFGGEGNYETVLLESKDGLTIKADVYEAGIANAPIILLFHQARFSRGEYRSIAPRLNELGYTCIAIDQRSGGKVKGVKNETFKQASKREMGTSYIDAYPDLELLLTHAKKKYPGQKIIVWGSSYSASLVMVLATQYSDDIAAVLAFSPGTYFPVEGKSILDYAARIKCPIFMTCSREEIPAGMNIFNRIKHESKHFYKPESEGHHGSKALWPGSDGNAEYWEAVQSFLSSLQE